MKTLLCKMGRILCRNHFRPVELRCFVPVVPLSLPSLSACAAVPADSWALAEACVHSRCNSSALLGNSCGFCKRKHAFIEQEGFLVRKEKNPLQSLNLCWCSRSIRGAFSSVPQKWRRSCRAGEALLPRVWLVLTELKALGRFAAATALKWACSFLGSLARCQLAAQPVFPCGHFQAVCPLPWWLL